MKRTPINFIYPNLSAPTAGCAASDNWFSSYSRKCLGYFFETQWITEHCSVIYTRKFCVPWTSGRLYVI